MLATIGIVVLLLAVGLGILVGLVGITAMLLWPKKDPQAK